MTAGERRERFVEADGVRLHIVEQGEGPPVVCLHGFPDFWYSWRLLLPELSAAGFRGIAPDLRGYNRSDRPEGIDPYRIRHLTADVATVIEKIAGGRAVVVGHDWGGILGWRLAARRPELVEKLVILNAPHPSIFRRRLVSSLQLLRSWYIGFFQMPVLPEAALGAFDSALLRGVLRAPASVEGQLDPDALRIYEAAFAAPGALSAAIAWYRALRRPDALSASGRVHCPTLVIWGEQDRHLDRSNLRGLEKRVAHLSLLRLPEAGHWVHLEAPRQVNARILRFLADGSEA